MNCGMPTSDPANVDSDGHLEWTKACGTSSHILTALQPHATEFKYNHYSFMVASF